jgi:hypothetical protein
MQALLHEIGGKIIGKIHNHFGSREMNKLPDRRTIMLPRVEMRRRSVLGRAACDQGNRSSGRLPRRSVRLCLIRGRLLQTIAGLRKSPVDDQCPTCKFKPGRHREHRQNGVGTFGGAFGWQVA